MLERQHRRRRQDRHLLAVHHRLERRPQRHFGLAVTDIAAQQPIHRHRRFHVALDVSDGGGLIRGQVVRERLFELFLPVIVGGERVARHRLARGVELQQLLGHVAHGLLHAALGPLPGGAAEAIERRPAAAGVLLHQVEALNRHEQLVVAVVAQLEELVRGVADADLLQADELADAVVDVHDQVADLEIAQVGEERRGQRPFARRAAAMAILFEDVAFGVQGQAGIGETHAAGERAHGDEDRPGGHFAGAGGQLGAHVVVGQHLHRAIGAAGGLGDEHHGLAGGTPVADVLDPVGDAAVEFLGRLGRDVPGGRRRIGRLAGALDMQACQRHAAGEPRRQIVARQQQLRRRRE